VKYPRPNCATIPKNSVMHKFTYVFPVNFTTLQWIVHSDVPVTLPHHAGLVYSVTLFLVAFIKYGTAHSGITEHRNMKCLKYRRRPESTEWTQSLKQWRWTFCQHTNKLRQKSHSCIRIDNA